MAVTTIFLLQAPRAECVSPIGENQHSQSEVTLDILGGGCGTARALARFPSRRLVDPHTLIQKADTGQGRP